MAGRQDRGITLAQLETLCGDWPGVARDIKWADALVFSVGGKMFLMTHADGREDGRLAFKVAAERFLELTVQAGVIPAPCLARAHWSAVTERQRFTTTVLRRLLRDAYATVRARLPKKAQLALDPLPALKDRK